MDDRYIVLFDGVCNLCNGSVNFIINRDPNERFVFAPVQSAIGQELIAQYDVPEVGVDTFLLIKEGRCYFKSDAALEIASDLAGGWRFIYGLKVVPVFIRDWVYTRVARNRYRMFGKNQQCMIPDASIKERFLQ
ncbi:MAG: thiol-disulfide oxidoreductase [Gammaproteobacteria bacterium]|nr:MAG: thiol-disulfide oxidoreductase [Gammaproteobacteria bacterium]